MQRQAVCRPLGKAEPLGHALQTVRRWRQTEPTADPRPSTRPATAWATREPPFAAVPSAPRGLRRAPPGPRSAALRQRQPERGPKAWPAALARAAPCRRRPRAAHNSRPQLRQKQTPRRPRPSPDAQPASGGRPVAGLSRRSRARQNPSPTYSPPTWRTSRRQRAPPASPAPRPAQASPPTARAESRSPQRRSSAPTCHDRPES